MRLLLDCVKDKQKGLHRTSHIHPDTVVVQVASKQKKQKGNKSGLAGIRTRGLSQSRFQTKPGKVTRSDNHTTRPPGRSLFDDGMFAFYNNQGTNNSTIGGSPFRYIPRNPFCGTDRSRQLFFASEPSESLICI